MAEIFSPKILCASSFRAYFSEIEKIYARGNVDVFLGNPHWTLEQRTRAEALKENYSKKSRASFEKNAFPRARKIFIATGGSGGKLRFVAHSTETLEASAAALIRFLNLPAGTPLNCFACLPPWHISGLMPFVRARISGGRLCVAENGGFHGAADFPEFRKSADEFWMNSLVPTQLRRILARAGGADWLRRFDFILLGGAAVPADLISRAIEENLKIGIGYGMTETASLVALWRPCDGEKIAGTPLPHAQISIEPESKKIAIRATSLGEALAETGDLVPLGGSDGVFLSNDEGFFVENGKFVVSGRADRYINSGGEKIDPALVEAALVRAGTPCAIVVGEADAEWGERVVAIVPADAPENLRERLREFLPSAMLPKKILRVPAMPFDEKGKIDRVALRTLLVAQK